MYRNLRDAIGATAAVIVCAILAMLLAAGLSLAGWKIAAMLAPAQGAAQQQIQNNDPNNRTTAQDAFTQLHEAIKGDVFKIHQDKTDFGDHPTDPQDKAQLDLDRSKCTGDVNAYNTDAQDMNMKDWMPAGYPLGYSIDICQ